MTRGCCNPSVRDLHLGSEIEEKEFTKFLPDKGPMTVSHSNLALMEQIGSNYVLFASQLSPVRKFYPSFLKRKQHNNRRLFF